MDGRVAALMGDVAIRDGTEAAILAEARAALAAFAAKGGAWRRAAEEKLAPLLSLLAGVLSELAKARGAEAPAAAAVAAASEQAAACIERVYEALRDALGRPSFDAAMAILFPGGTGFYTAGSADEKPARMELLAQLLEAGVHPKVPLEAARALAKETRGAGRALREAVDAARIPTARVKLLEEAVLVAAAGAQAELIALGELLEAKGLVNDPPGSDGSAHGHAQGPANGHGETGTEAETETGSLKLA
jgi:hypothetical protein